MANDLSREQTDALLAKLSGDKEFHAAFAADPASALKSIGLPTALAACMQGKTLASMEQIGKASQAVAALFADTRTLAQNVHDLVAR